MTRPNDRVFFVLCALAGLVILLGCALPTFEFSLSASVGAGDEQRVYDYRRDLRLLTYREPGGLVFPLVGAALFAIGVAGAVRPRTWVVVAAVTLTLPAFVQMVRTVDYTDSSACDEARLEDCIGYLAPAVQEFREDVTHKPESRLPGYNPPLGRAGIRGLGGWQLVAWASTLISLVAWFRAIVFAAPRPRAAVPIYAGLLLIVFVIVVAWWLRDFDPN
jgi:hypothetical protein